MPLSNRPASSWNAGSAKGERTWTLPDIEEVK